MNRPIENTVVGELVDELTKAHLIIRIALNTLKGVDKQKFLNAVCDAELDGEGITRANEREALLARIGSES